jgi:hypothetical protein
MGPLKMSKIVLRSLLLENMFKIRETSIKMILESVPFF